MAYPKRESFHAHKLVRALHKVCGPSQIGPQAALIVVLVAHTEDAKRYSGPVTFYNGQLCDIIGIRKWETLDRHRKAAVDAGWLHYEPNGDRHKPGVYWTLIPDEIRVDDAPVDEGKHPIDGYADGYRDGYAEGYRVGHAMGDGMGEPSTPTPKPKPGAKSSGKKGQTPRSRMTAVERSARCFVAAFSLSNGEIGDAMKLTMESDLSEAERADIKSRMRGKSGLEDFKAAITDAIESREKTDA